MRPEHENPPEIFYNDDEARKYTKNTRIQEIQASMTERALELLGLEEGMTGFILDIGCGSGLSGDILEENGHYWVGIDISASMLDIANEGGSAGDLFLQDAGQGLGFRPGTFDGVISISCLQWLCNADYKYNNPRKRLVNFFTTIYGSLKQGARAVFQFYPENEAQIELITSTALLAGFSGGLTIDFPESTKKKKYFLCLVAGSGYDIPAGLSEVKGMDMQTGKVHVEGRIKERRFGSSSADLKGRKRAGVKDRDWVQRKKETRRRRGQQTANDSKFTARKRRPKF